MGRYTPKPVQEISVSKALGAGCSKRSQRRGARNIDERKRTLVLRCSEAIERNEAYEAFSAACLGATAVAVKIDVQPRRVAVAVVFAGFHDPWRLRVNLPRRLSLRHD